METTTNTLGPLPAAAVKPRQGAGPGLSKTEWTGWSLAICAINLPLLFGMGTQGWSLIPALTASEPWRWVTHPIAHVSLYHLLLDASAFLCLLHSIPGKAIQRIGLTVACSLGATLGALLDPVDLNLVGFGGLSGIAHGLAVYAGWLTWRDTKDRSRFMGLAVIAIVILKSVWEAATGSVFLQQLHIGSIGTPITHCHLGGAIGGLVGIGIAYLHRSRQGA